MNWLAYFLKLLPIAANHAQSIGTSLQGHEKKAIVTDIFSGIVEGVAQVSPGNAQAAATAAALASQLIDMTVSVMKHNNSFVPAPAPVENTTVPASLQQ